MEDKTKIMWGSMLLLAASIFVFNFVLADSSQVDDAYLTSDGPPATLTYDRETYNVELVSASDTTATIKVSQVKEFTHSKEGELLGIPIMVHLNPDKTSFSRDIDFPYVKSSDSERALGLLISVNSEKETSIENVNKDTVPYELIVVSRSDNSATIRASQTKEIKEGESKKVGGLEIKIFDAKKTNLKLSATLSIKKAEYEIIIEEGETEYGGYVLRDIKIEGDILKIKISDLGGCWKGDFNLIWDGNYLKSIPPQVNLHLNLNEYRDVCKALISKDLEFNLKKLRVAGEKSIKINFYVSSKDTGPKYVLTYNYGNETSGDIAVCPEDIKNCPDSSFVRRELPDCKFPKCPDECENIGLRNDGKYCSINKVLFEQKSSGEKCENNFECESNVCVSGECVSEGLLKKILNWFKSLFGFG